MPPKKLAILSPEEQTAYRAEAKQKHIDRKVSGLARKNRKHPFPHFRVGTPEEQKEYQRLSTVRSLMQHKLGRPVEYAEGPLKICGACKEAKPRTEEYFWRVNTGFHHACRNCSAPPKFYMSKAEKTKLTSTKPCSVCGTTKNLKIDHCHDAHKFRGVLCMQCNFAVGLMDDNPELLERAAAYLRKSGLYRTGARRGVQAERFIRFAKALVKRP